MYFAVDIPDRVDPTGSWFNMDFFDTREQAIAFVREYFGGDDKGCICLVSEIADSEEEA